MTKRELESKVEALQDEVQPSDGVTGGELTVEWDEAAPQARPSGIRFDHEDGVLTYDLWAAQRECLQALDGGADLVAFLAGYGSGKSIVGARWTIANALAHPGSQFLVMGQSFAEARDSTFATLFGQLPGERTGVLTASFNGPEESPIVADYNRGERRLTLLNDTEITLGSADKWSRYAGAEFGGIWLDEPSHYGTDLHDLLEILGSRLRGVAGPNVQCWTLTGNGYNAAWEILAQRQDSTGEPLGLDIEVIRASTLENPYLDADVRDRFERQYEGTERATQALYGGFAAAQGLVYSGFQRDRHVIAHEEARERLANDWRLYGYDAGWRDPRVVLELGKTDYGQFVVLDMFYEQESHVDDAITWLAAADKPPGVVCAEHEPADIRKFRRAGYQATQAEKAINPGIADVRRRLEADADGRVGLLVSERCKPLIREFLGYKKAAVGTTGAEDHCLDALRYAIHTTTEHHSCSSWGEREASTQSSTSPAIFKTGTEGALRRDRREKQSGRHSRLGPSRRSGRHRPR